MTITAAAPAATLVSLTSLAALQLPNAADLTSRAERALAFIESLPVTCAEDYGLAVEELKGVKSRWKTLEEQRTSISGPLNQAFKAVNALFAGPMGLLEKAETVLKTKLVAYDTEQARQRAEAMRKAEEAAAAERAALEAEALRKAAEAKAIAEAAEKAAATGDATAAAVADERAQRARDEAEAARAAAQMVVAQPPAQVAAQVPGVSTAKGYDFEVTSLHDLAAHIVAHPELVNLIQPNEPALRKYVAGLGMACRLPGVRVSPKPTMRIRA